MRAKKVLIYFWRFTRFLTRNLIRVLFLFFTILAIAVVVFWFTALKYFNAEHVGTVLTQALQSGLNRPVALGSVRLVSLNAIEIRNLTIIDNSTDVYNEFISAGSVIIRYNLLPLREGRVVIEEVIINNPSISIIRDKNGILNTADLKAAGSQIAGGTRFDLTLPDGRPLQIIIEDWAINDGTISYRDIAANTSHSLNNVSVRFNNLKFNDFTDYSLKFILRNNLQGSVIETEIDSRGEVNLANFSPKDMVLKNAEAQVRGFGKPLSFDFNIEDFVNPRVNFSVKLPSFKYEDISLFVKKPFAFEVPAFNIESKISFEDGFKKINISSLNIKNKDINADINGHIETAPLAARLNFQTKEFEASAVDYPGILKPYAVKGRLAAAGEFIYENGKPIFPKVTADINGASALIQNFTIQNVKAKYEAVENFNVMNAAVQNGVFKVGRQTVNNVKGKASYEHKKQNFYALLDNSQFNGQNIKMSVAISKVRSERDRAIKTMLHVEKFDPIEVFDTVEDFAAALAGNKAGASAAKDTSDLAWLRNFRAMLPAFMQNISGSVYADKFTSPIATGSNFNAEVSLRGMRPGMDALYGKIDLKLENGTILQLQEAADRWKALGVAFQPFVIMNNMERMGTFKMNQVLKDTPFDILRASADFDNGKMNINNFYLDGRVIAATVGGRVDWVGEDMDLDIFTMFKNTPKRGVLSENLTDESGEPALAFRASGSMQKPVIAIKSPKKTGAHIKTAREKEPRTDFAAIQKFIKGR